MKTHLLCSLFAVLFLPALKAQTDFRFADSTAQWNVLYMQWYFSSPRTDFGTRIYKLIGDTVVNNLSYQVIRNGGNAAPKYFLRKDSLQKIYGLRDTSTSEKLLYDFNMSVGDTMQMSNILGVSWMETWARVDSIDTIQANGLRKRIFISYKIAVLGAGFSNRLNDKWIEGIGSENTDFLAPGVNLEDLDGPSARLLCFFEKDTSVYHRSAPWYPGVDTSSCEVNFVWMDIDEQPQSKITIAPNPITDDYAVVNFEKVTYIETTFELFDVTGRVILQKKLYDKVSRVDLDGVSSGLYLYAIAASGQKLSWGKLVMQ